METSAEKDPLEELTLQIMSILDEPTVEKSSLVERFDQLVIDSEKKLLLCMELVFEKSLMEPTYAQLCRGLQNKNVGGSDGRQVTYFWKLLLARCQEEFESGDDTEELEEEERRLVRRRQFGNFILIGELYKLNMLTAGIMHECVKKLLKTKDEEHLVCLCKVLSRVGKDLEIETKEKMKEKGGGLQFFKVYFNQMRRLADSEEMSPRVRSMLQSVVELRKNGWEPMKGAKENANAKEAKGKKNGRKGRKNKR